MDTNQPNPEVRLHFLDYWRVIKTRKAVVFVVFLLVLLTTSVVTYLQPRIYSAACRIKVEPERPDVAVNTPQQYTETYDPYFLATQYEIIQSQKILEPTVERMNLVSRWSEGNNGLTVELAAKRLKNQMQVRRFRDTSLIEIVAFDRDPRLAADIANMIAEIFEKERLEVKRGQVMKGLDKLKEEIADQQEKLRLAQAKVEKLRKDLNVPVVGNVKLSDLTIEQMQQQLTAARAESVTTRSRLNELKKLTPTQLRNTIATIISDPNVQSLLQSLTDTELRLEVAKEDYGPEHPNVRAAIAQRDKLQEQLDARLEGVMRGFEVQAKMAEERVNDLQKQLDEVKNQSVGIESEKFLPFKNAQRDEESETRLLDVLKQRFAEETISINLPRSPVELIDSARPNFVPVSPNMVLNISLGAVVGLLLGVALTFFIEFLDTSVKIMDDVERYLGLPVLGVVPQDCVLLSRPDASPAHLEAYRMLRTNIDFSQPNGEHHALAVLSAGAGEGKSFTLANLGYVYAQQGKRVLIVDSDLRRPSVHKSLNVACDIGLSDYLAGTNTVDEIVKNTGVQNVWIITAGSSTSAKTALPLLTSQRMNQLIQEVAHRYDIVLYDTPPILGISDAAVVAREVGNAILVVQHRRFPRAMSQRARKMIENAGGRLLGVVVNNVHVGQDDTYYYYHDRYETYMRGVEHEPTKAEPRKPSQSDEIELQGKY